MKYLFRKKWKQSKTYADKLPWVAIQSDLLEVSRGSSRGGSRSSSPNPEEGGSGGCWCLRVCLLRLLQLVLLLATLTTAANFLASALLVAPASRPRPVLSSVHENALPNTAPTTLLDLNDFELVHEAEAVCSPSRLFFVFLVHSRPDHFRQRQAIRATWGGARHLEDGWAARTVFLLGQGRGGYGDTVAPQGLGFDVEGVVEREVERYGDVVVGSFVDHYYNLTYKHVMGLRWAARRCSHATFIVKVDDDAFIDVMALQALLGRTFNMPPPRLTLACNALPAGTRPQRTGKWAVSSDVYPWPEYPRYCAGLAYVATPTVADLLARAAQAEVVPRVWVDDVWVTGLLAEALDLRPHFLNLRYSYDQEEVVRWAVGARPAAPPPYIFVHLDSTRPDYRSTLDTLWTHALTAYNSTTKWLNATTTTTLPTTPS